MTCVTIFYHLSLLQKINFMELKETCQYAAINVQTNQLDDCYICHIVYFLIVYLL